MKKFFSVLAMQAALLCPPGSAHAQDDIAEINRQSLIAVRTSNLPGLRKLMDQGASVNTRNRFGDSLLMTAIKSGSA
ncbi:MAG: hypothetical protein ACJ8G3_08410, partial [Burkholderiaceae bacterium]